MTPGHELFGIGPTGVIVTHDWLCDTSTWDHARCYLDGIRFTYAFTDLRGYGRSRALDGEHTVREAANDLLALADHLRWSRFSIVGHSMSSLIALDLAQQHPTRVACAVLLTPPPPRGFQAPPEQLAAIRAIALADDAGRARYFAHRFTEPGFGAFKATRWRATADPAAAADYVYTFARDGMPDAHTRITPPMLAVFGEDDSPPLRREAVEPSLSLRCNHLAVTTLPVGHYPMQEMPPQTVAVVERFLRGSAGEAR